MEWFKDVDVAIISACAILDIGDLNGNYYWPWDKTNPGLAWAATGPGVLLGYNHLCPGDSRGGNPNFNAELLDNFFYRNFQRGESLMRAWLNANKDMAGDATDNPYNACAIVRNGSRIEYWYWNRADIQNPKIDIKYFDAP